MAGGGTMGTDSLMSTDLPLGNDNVLRLPTDCDLHNTESILKSLTVSLKWLNLCYVNYSSA
jgi:hypothetical protein